MNENRLTSGARIGYGKLITAAEALKSPFLLAVRLYWGWQFFQTGMGKLGDLATTTGFFKELGIPFPAFNAAMAGTTECVGGLLLLIGLASRLTTIPLIVTMIVAYLTADLEAVKSIFADADKFVTAAPFLFLFASLIIIIFGPGKFSMDHLLVKKFHRI